MRILLLNQCFYPDVVSTAQHLTDLALDLAGQGHEVSVIASSRGYDNPEIRFPKKEVWNDINIIRIPVLGLGKKSKWRRALDFGSFLANCVMRLALLSRFDLVVALTSPPLISFLGAAFTKIKGGRFVFWVMDLNPDEAVAAGWLKEQSLLTKSLASLLSYSLKNADLVVVLDRFMKERIIRKGVREEKVSVIPPWSHDDTISYSQVGRDEFRSAHGFEGKYVVMYSGNHSPCHPLDTLLCAARELVDRPEIMFCFVGGGSEFKKVKEFAAEQGLDNIRCLPYQPLDQLSASLSAADLHVVVMGDPYPGIVHPCKIYNILAIGAPFLYIGPEDSHVSDILREMDDGPQKTRTVRHGEVQELVNKIVESSQAPNHCRSVLQTNFSKEALLPGFVQKLEQLSEADAAMNLNSCETDIQNI